MPPAAATKVKLYKATRDLARSLYKDSHLEATLRNAIIGGKKGYYGIPFGNHLWVLWKIDPDPKYLSLLAEYKRFLSGDLSPKELKEFPDKLINTFKDFYDDPLKRGHLEGEVDKYEAGEVEHPSFVTPEEHQELTAAESLPTEPARVAALENFTGANVPQMHAPVIPQVPLAPTPPLPKTPEVPAAPGIESGDEPVVYHAGQTAAPTSVIPAKAGIQIKDSGVVAAAPPQNDRRPAAAPLTQRIGANLRNLKIPRIPQGLTLPIGKFIRRNVTLTRLTSLFTGGLGAIVGYGATKTVAGAALGGVAGASLPYAVKQRGFGNFSLNLASRVGHGGADFIGGISSGGRAIGSGVSRVGEGFTGRRAFILAFILLMGMAVIILLTGAAPPGTTLPGSGTPITGGGGNIASCTFFRGGDRTQGLTFGNPAMAALISDISNKVVVPPAIIAGIMRVETGGALASTDPTYLSNDYDAHCSLPARITQTTENCSRYGIAFGIMQFTPPTFTSTFTTNSTDMLGLFNKSSSKTAIDPQSGMASSDILRIYSIKDSIIATAFKVRADKQLINRDGPWDEATVKTIAARYYGTNADGTTNYSGWDGSTQNYGNDLWKSYSSCQATTVPNPAPDTLASLSCPIPGGRIICASYGKQEAWTGFNNVCAIGSNSATGEADIGGHCSPRYRSSYPGLCSEPGTPKAYISGGNLKRTAKSIDVGGSVGTPVYIPTVNGQRLRWFFVSDFSDDVGATLRVFQSEQTPQGKWTIHFVHTSADPFFRANQEVDTNQYVARIASGNDHVHVTVGLNIQEPVIDNNLQVYDPNWKFPDRELGMCR